MPSARFQPAFTSGVLGPALWGELAGCSAVVRMETKAALCGLPGCDSSALPVKMTDMCFSAVYSNAGPPAPLSDGHNSRCAAFVIGPQSGVSCVLHVGNIAQVCYPVVRRIAVNVVDFPLRPLAVENGPSDSVGPDCPTEYRAALSAEPISGLKRWLSGVLAVPRADVSPLWTIWDRAGKPCQHSCIRVIREQLTQFVRRGKGLLSHAMLQSSLWLGTGRCYNSFWSRHYTRAIAAYQGKGVCHSYS